MLISWPRLARKRDFVISMGAPAKKNAGLLIIIEFHKKSFCQFNKIQRQMMLKDLFAQNRFIQNNCSFVILNKVKM